MIQYIKRLFLAVVLILLAVGGFFLLLGASGVAFLLTWPIVVLLFSGAVAILNK